VPVVSLLLAPGETLLKLKDAGVEVVARPPVPVPDLAGCFAATLNRALKLDPGVIDTLFHLKRQCGNDLASDPSIIVGGNGDQPDGRWWVRVPRTGQRDAGRRRVPGPGGPPGVRRPGQPEHPRL
jgi:hypothetical protein